MSYTKNYTMRTVDLSVLNMLPTSDFITATLNFADKPEVVAGPQKAIQAWTINFLTVRGSVLGDPEYGTDFIGQVLRGELRDATAVEGAFEIAAQAVRTYQVQRGLFTNPDEQVVRAELQDGWDFDMVRGKIDLRVKLVLQSGNSVPILIPIATVF